MLSVVHVSDYSERQFIQPHLLFVICPPPGRILGASVTLDI
jgi:hypothetical protein